MKLELRHIDKCERIDSPNGRLYQTPDGNLYPSVTTVLGSLKNPELDKRVGDAAAKRGTLIHEAAENYILCKNKEVFKWFHTTEKKMFAALKIELDKFEVVYALEQGLWSDKLHVAGTVDCIAKIDGRTFIVDFKTSRRFKTAEEIYSYYMQCAAYAVAWYERTGELVTMARILITTEDDGVLVYDVKLTEWVTEFKLVRQLYENQNN
jgi:genome maintenance exonuclease 1